MEVKVKLGTFPDFVYFSSSLQTIETAWKRGDTIFSQLEMQYEVS